MSGDVGSRALRAAAIKVLGAVPVNLLSFALTLLCARWLAPEAYGAWSLALAIYGFADMLTNPASTTYLVRMPGCSDLSIDVAWTFTAGRALVLAAGLWLLAPLLSAAFGGGEEVTRMLRVLCLGFAGTGLVNLHHTRFHHELRFGRVLLVESLGTALGTVLAIVLLYLTREPLSLAVGLASGYWMNAVASWLVAPRLARPHFHVAELRRMWSFTRFLLANRVIVYALVNLDSLLVAKLAGTAALGLYAMSFRIVNATVLFVIRPLADTLLPALANLLADRGRFTRAALTAVSAFAAVSFMITSGAWMLAEEIFAVIGGRPEWESAAPIFRTLLPFVLIRAINGSLGATVTAAGKPHVLTIVSGSQLAAMVPLAALGFWLHGFLGLVVAITVLNAGAMLTLVVIAPHFVDARRSFVLSTLLAPLPAALVSALAAWFSAQMVELAALRLIVGFSAVIGAFTLVWELTCHSAWGVERGATSLVGLLRRIGRKRVPDEKPRESRPSRQCA
jgi:PST family polysaccharide transporter